MKNNFIRIVTTCLVIATGSLYAQTARVQIIHNSADAAAATVDIYVNNVLTFNDFAFRTATPFTDVPAGVQLAIGVAPGNSTGPSDIIATFNQTFANNGKYVVVANGIVSPTGYTPNQPFGLDVYSAGQEAATLGTNTDVLVVHGSTDAPTVDVTNVTTLPSGTLVNDISYGEIQGYLNLPTADYAIQVRTAAGVDPVAEYGAPLQTLGLQGAALVVVASGFLDPANNSNGAAFGLYAALPTGGALVALPSLAISTARLQAIHNSPDAMATQVDVYINDVLALDNFAFRTASPFVEVKTTGTIKIAAPNSTSSAQALFTKNLNLVGGERYFAIASGLTNPNAGYTPYQAFDVIIVGDALETGSDINNTDIQAFHGATDAPTVDIYNVTSNIEVMLDNLAYGTASGYVGLPVSDYAVQVRTADGQDAVAEYSAPLQTLGLGGQSLLVLASGFLNPSVNNNGPAFGLYVALPSGGNLIPLPSLPISTARVQIIHNAADPAAAQVDVAINGNTLLDNFAFRSATGFLDVKTNVTYNIEIKTADGATTLLAAPAFNPVGGEKYVVIAQGVAGSGFETNADPDADSKALTLYVKSGAKEKSPSENTFDFLGVHGSTDAPKVDIVAPGVTVLLDNISYGDIAADYLTVPAAQYVLNVTPANDNNTVVAAYDVNVSTLGGKAGVVFASGFLTPVDDNNGHAFSLCYALSDGTTGCFSLATSVNENELATGTAIYPNPANSVATFEYNLIDKSNLTLRIVDYTGRVVENIYLGNQAAGLYRQAINLSKYSAGIYTVQLSSGNNTLSKKLVITN